MLIRKERQARGSDKDQRALYVGMTRARNNLYICTNDETLATFESVPGVVLRRDIQEYPVPDALEEQMTLRDVHLDFFMNDELKRCILSLRSGAQLELGQDKRFLYAVHNNRRFQAVKLSSSALGRLRRYTEAGYVLNGASIQFIVAWKKAGTEGEWAVPLPLLRFSRRSV